MMRYILLVLLGCLLLSACNDSPKPTHTNPKPIAKPEILGLMEIDLLGLNTQEVTARARPYRSDNIATQSLDDVAKGLDIRLVNTHSELVAGRRYLYATFEVRNAEHCAQGGTCPAYSTALNNAVFMAVDTTTTLGNTAIKRIVRADNSNADATFASKMKPSHALQYNASNRALEIVNAKANFQAFSETEAASLNLSAEPSVVDVLPWGFSIVNRTNSSSRTLAANPAAKVYDGLVTFAFSYPDAATTADDVKEISIVIQASRNSVARVTEGIEEQGISKAEARADAANNSEVMLLGNSPTTVTGNALQRLCSLRYAGTSSAPLYLFKEDTGRCAALNTAKPSDAANIAIPDATSTVRGKLTRPLTISGTAGQEIHNLKVHLDITHEYLWNLYITLISPQGTRVKLTENLLTSTGSQCQAVFTTVMQVTLNDAAAASIDRACPFAAKEYRPFGQLSDFAGEKADGVWTLEIQDVAPGNVGRLKNWALEINTGKTTPFSQVYINQASQNTQQQFGGVPLVAGRSGMARAFLTQNLINQLGIAGTPQEARIYAYRNNTFVGEMLLTGPSAAYPNTIDENATANSYNARVPSAWLATATSFRLAITSSAGRVRYPATGLFEPEILANAPFNVSAVPIKAGNARVPDVASNIDTWLYYMQWLFPLPDNGINKTLSSQFTTSSTSISKILSELELKRTNDKSTNYYLGFYNPESGGGALGLAYQPGKAAVVWPTPNGRAINAHEYAGLTVAHEVGHNFRRKHNSGLCGAQGLDAQYPYGHGIGAWGINLDAQLASRSFLRDKQPEKNPQALTATYSTPGHQDIMGYCERQWVSDYTYTAVARYRFANDVNPQTQSLQFAHQEATPATLAASQANNLLVWGILHSDGNVELRPSFHTDAAISHRAEDRVPVSTIGSFQLELVAADDTILATIPFSPMTLDHNSSQHFQLIVQRPAALHAIRVVNINDAGRHERAHLQHPHSLKNSTREDNAMPQIHVRQANARASHNIILWWQASPSIRAIILRDPDTLEMIGYAEGEQLELASDYGKDSIIVESSNGISSQRQLLSLR